MNRRILLAACLVVIPTLATAQRGGGTRTEADKRSPMFDKTDEPKGPALRVRDVEDQSPIKLLIDKRKDLKLTDAQLNALKDGESKLKTVNAPLLKAIDSLVHEAKPPMNQTDETRARIRDAMQGIMRTLNSIKENYDASAKEALATFDPEQQKKAGELLGKQREEGDKMIREKLGAGGERRGGL